MPEYRNIARTCRVTIYGRVVVVFGEAFLVVGKAFGDVVNFLEILIVIRVYIGIIIGISIGGYVLNTAVDHRAGIAPVGEGVRDCRIVVFGPPDPGAVVG